MLLGFLIGAVVLLLALFAVAVSSGS